MSDAPDRPEPGADDHLDEVVAPDAAGPRGASRRGFLKRAGLSSAAVVAGGIGAHKVIPHSHPTAEAAASALHDPNAPANGIGVGGALPGSQVRNLYGHGAEPPAHLPAGHLDAVTIPPPFDGRPAGTVRDYEFTVTARPLQVANGITYPDAWTYNATAPGPILRATEGDTLRVTVHNRTQHDHNLHLHGRHSPLMDGWEPIVPGASFTYEVTAAPFGIHPYHCHTPPLAQHVSRGLYGAMIVDPPGGRPPAHEFVLVLSGWDADGDLVNEVHAFNGVAGYFGKFPIKVPVGELVRVYVLNMTEYQPLASFHLHAQTFDVFRTGTRLDPDEHTDTVTLGQGERAIVEFTLPEPGRYMFHPHQHHLAETGAMGWFAAI